MAVTTAAFVIYLALVAAIAFAAWSRTRTMTDYALGGRRVSAPVAALSAGASDMSGWLLLGLPGLAVVAPGAAVWTAVGLLVGTWCNWRFIATPLRATSAELGALTLPAFFARKFPSRGGLLRLLCAGSIVVFFLLYTSAGLVAAGKLFSTVFAVDYAVSVVAGTVLIALYTLLGGFLAVAWTDVLQAMLMAAMLLVVAGLLWFDAAAANSARILQHQPGVTAAISALAWGLGYMGQPHILARFMALSARESVPRARRIACTWSALGLLAAVAIGSAGHALVPAAGDPEKVFMLAASILLNPWFAGICLAAILAAIMSTADSQLLVTAITLAEDVLPDRPAGQANDTARIAAGRLAVLVVCVLAAALALRGDAGVLHLVARAWAGFGATLGPALILALYDPRASAEGAVGGIIAGAVVVIVWPLLPQIGDAIYELLPAFCCATLTNLALNRWPSGARGVAR